MFFYFFGFFLFISCSSENNVNNNDLSNKSETGVNMTLKEVLKERATQDEIDFAYSNIIDNRKYNYFKYDSKISLRIFIIKMIYILKKEYIKQMKMVLS